MADNNTNPSIVNDDSGNNYGGINPINMGGGMQAAQMQYLDNLFALAQKMPPKPLTQEQYFPGSNRSIVQGQVALQGLGSFPLIAAGTGLFPFGMVDEAKRSQAEAEAAYYKTMMSEADKPLFSQKLQLADPWRQPAFSQKVMDTADSYLNTYTEKFGGDVAKAYIATRNDKNFQRTIQSYADYANMYNTVYNKAIEIEAAKNDKAKGIDTYVDQDAAKAVNRFLYSHENLTNLKPDELLEESKKIHSTLSATALAAALTTGYKDQVKQTDYARSEYMSTDELDMYISKKKTNAGAAEEIIKNGLEAYPWLKSDPEQKAVFERSVRNRVAYSEEQVIKDLKKNNADRDLALRKNGWLDEKGDIKIQNKPAALVNTTGRFAISYPPIDKPMASTTNMRVHVLSGGKIHTVDLPESYDMVPKAEYDITEKGTGIPPQRVVETKMNFQSSELYTPSETLLTGAGAKVQRQTIRGKQTTQIIPVTTEDVYTHEPVKLFGPTTVLVPYDEMENTMEAALPNLSYVHDKMKNMAPSLMYIGVQTGPGNKTGHPSTAEPIPLTDDMTIWDLDPDLRYSKGDVTLSGKEWILKYNALQNK